MTVIDRGHVATADSDSVERLRRTWPRKYAKWLAILDAIGVVLAVGLAQWVRFGNGDATHYTGVSVLIAVGWMLTLSVNRSRSPGVIGSGTEEYRRVWVGTLTVFGAVALVSMLFKLEVARGYLLTAVPTGLLLLITFRWIARRVLVRERLRHGRCITRVLVVGSSSAVRDLTRALAREPWFGYSVVGACIPGMAGCTTIAVPGVGSIPVYGDESHVVEAVAAAGSNTVAVTAAEQLDGRRIGEMSWQLEKLDVDLVVAPGVIDVAGPRLQMRPVAGLPLIHLARPTYSGTKRFQKRLFDTAFSSIVLVLAAPVLLAVAMAIKLTSSGPVFFRQERIGLDGQPFKMIKFRTMVDGADTMVADLAGRNESDSGVLFKIRNDPRITPVGRFLRKYSLDELPQFINVLTHDMSVVGPRPPLASEVTSYDDYVRRRLLVRPGVTGLWQISGRSDLSWEDAVRLDLFYVENWSMVTDLIVVLKTVKAVLTHSGAY